MAESIITDWIADFAALEPAELRTFAAEHEHNHEVAQALFTIIGERFKYPELLHSISQQLCAFYRSAEKELRKFTLQFLPSFIYVYLNSVAQGDKKSCRSVETLLIAMYNTEMSNADGEDKIVTFRMPVLAQASIYHEAKSLNASDLRRWEENSNKDVSWGPLQPVESLNAQNRLKVMTALLFVYNQQLSLIQKSALAHLCRAASQLANQGFSKLSHAHRASYGTDPSQAIAPKPLPRIPMSSQFLVEMLHAVYFAMFNEFGSIAIQSVEDIHNRACYELYPEVILVSNAVRNSLHANPSGQPSDGPMGISVALTPATTTVTVSKSMITNASFRTKKLPDDLEVEIVAALEAQLQQENRDIIAGHIDDSWSAASPSSAGSTPANQSPKEHRKLDHNKKRWKNWGWKYSPGGKTSSIEEEPESPKQSTSRLSSPANSPKHRSTKTSDGSLEPATGSSPLRRQKSPSPSAISGTGSGNRSSAGARLCQMIDDSQDESGDELQALLINGRPASVHIVQLTSDDIPIQGPNADGSGPNSAGPASGAALVSISEESENDPQQHGANKNANTRGGKDTPKGHKVPFPAFMKSKDKDAAKLAATKSIGSVDITDATALATKEASSSATKASHKKDKFANRGSIGISLQMSVDAGDGCADRTSAPAGAVVFKRHLDFGTSDMVALQSFSNGGGDEDQAKLTATGDSNGLNGVETTIESSADNFASDQSKRISVVDLKMHSLQMSHV